jgi:hypothetical protein
MLSVAFIKEPALSALLAMSSEDEIKPSGTLIHPSDASKPATKPATKPAAGVQLKRAVKKTAAKGGQKKRLKKAAKNRSQVAKPAADKHSQQ